MDKNPEKKRESEQLYATTTRPRPLQLRIKQYKAEILRFATDRSVPFTNNEAERAIRFTKVKQKVSGCFRTETGAREYAFIMRYINTAIKRGVTFMEAIKKALTGQAVDLVAGFV